MGDFIYGVIGGICTGIGLTLIWASDRMGYRIRLEQQRGNHWYRRYREACVSVDDANRAAWDAEQRAAVQEAEAIVKVRAA